MRSLLRPLITLLLASSSAYSFAHSGHDHQHWLSEPIHALSLLALLAVLSLVIYKVRAKTVRQQTIKNER